VTSGILHCFPREKSAANMSSTYDLNEDEIYKLAAAASEAKKTAYCECLHLPRYMADSRLAGPYSKFRVGAALLLVRPLPDFPFSPTPSPTLSPTS
jgi:hypothetical protein